MYNYSINSFERVDIMGFREIKPNETQGNVFEMIGCQWMLITAGNQEKCNMMTASWGGLGFLWNKNVATCYIRPQRYTREFVEREKYFTLSFFGEEYRKALNLCGSKSGRDIDKIAEAGLTPAFCDCGGVYFEEANVVLCCRKIYTDVFKPENFLENSIEANYPDKDYHHIYIGEILKVFVK
jgi:flavin reductase (DIM6/NTAB) family NADH-FMN oxidoreductase RutF